MTPNKELSLSQRIQNYIVFVSVCSILITVFLCFFSQSVIGYAFNTLCHKPKADNFPENTIYRAINLNHTIKTNKNNKAKLIDLFSDVTTWYGKTREKNNFHFKSKYDCFCFTNSPRHDLIDPVNSNYELVINGFHRYRKPTKNFVKLETLYARIEKGKIKELKTVDLDQHEGVFPDWINKLYHFFGAYFFIGGLLFGGALCLLLIVFDKFEWLRSVPVLKGFLH